MAGFDYKALKEAIRTALQKDAELRDIDVEIDPDWVSAEKDTIGIYLERRDAPDAIQGLSAGLSTEYLIRFSIWCFTPDFGSRQRAAGRRDILVQATEAALMRDRSLQDTVSYSYLEGGDFDEMFNDEQAGFIAAGEIILVARASADI